MINRVLVFGAGYVGLSSAVLLSQYINVTVVDIDKKKIKLLKENISPISDSLIQEFLDRKKLSLSFESEVGDISDKDIIILALPTNFNDKLNAFDTSILENTIKQISNHSKKLTIIIKSTVPVGFSNKMQKKYPCLQIIFMPEFLREGSAIEDNINPDRLILSSEKLIDNKIIELLLKVVKNEPSIIYMSTAEAEASKLFSNTYLAARVSFFNELDSFCLDNKLNTKNVISGVSSDKRIGNGYNNPSFGYGGYCLPKDTKQLLSNFKSTPQNIFSSIIESNITRKKFLAKKILQSNAKKIGVYKLVMKEGSDNFRESAILDLLKILKKSNHEIFIYEPLIHEEELMGCKVIESLDNFINESDIIISNRIDKDISHATYKVFSRDVFGVN